MDIWRMETKIEARAGANGRMGFKKWKLGVERQAFGHPSAFQTESLVRRYCLKRSFTNWPNERQSRQPQIAT